MESSRYIRAGLAIAFLVGSIARETEAGLDSCSADSGDCKKTPGVLQEDASAAQMEHWRQWYWGLDTNHDGTVSGKDRDISIQRHLDAYDLDHTSPVVKKIAKLWNELALLGHEEELTPAQFVVNQNEEYKRLGKEDYIEKVHENLRGVFEAHDSDGDGFYTEDEYKQLYKNYGHRSFAADHRMFESYSPAEGKVPGAKIAKAWADFITLTDKDHDIEDMIIRDGMN